MPCFSDMPIWFCKANPQILPNLAKSSQARAKKIRGINFVFLGRIELFQGVALTPKVLFSFLAFCRDLID
jgi:hypothetical protein